MPPPPIAPAEKPFPHTLAGTGIIEALRENVAIGVPEPGLVQEVQVKAGQTVKQGDALFKLDDRLLIAQLAAQQSSLRIDNQRLSLETDLDNQLATYLSQQQILGLEEDNVRIARENLNVSTERFRLGTTNGLEPQIAQNSLEQALSRRDLVLYNLKVAEIQLRLLAGEL